MGSDKFSQDQDIIERYSYVKPGKPLIYLWIIGVTIFCFFIEGYIFDIYSFLGLIISTPGVIFFIFMMYIAFTGAAKLEIDGESIRKSLLGWDVIRISWTDAKVIQSFPFPVQGVGLLHYYRVVSKNKFLFFGIIAFSDESEALPGNLSLIAKRYGIPIEQRFSQFGKLEKVDVIRFIRFK
ncbi:hypothetical protein [Xanthomonas sp. GPE 39]|uniref:hypothetical protein n=1 Tax=Xanthomonas sp. GPE 39 TaxID=1583099 RepID=UPI00126A2663|nr:hypothetical protein [Xanthomonas sp. GPE 39]